MRYLLQNSTLPSYQVSTDDIHIPLPWITGTLLTTTAIFFSIIWWVRGLKSNVDESNKRLDLLEKKITEGQVLESNHRNELKEDLRISLRRDIAESASDICHGFELFAVENRQNIKQLSEKLESRDKQLEKLDSKVEYLADEFAGLIMQLQSQGLGIHSRQTKGPGDQRPR
ncbi:hypothetical protein H6G45_09240 [Synechocystis sp. FACHB-383]|uniref:hypothetical protein n=1 Tax=Synechocystis sp. FACHB-383 TaxID=2692864 RepID=UPI00168A016F|nr:hypothetical protein [Synechocystis sp. FACHB-383]MBD2653670.1 hypothetical protein [Synechocystis sp. FACHB-383]